MLEELFCAHRAELTAYCRGLCRSDAAAQDMVQEVFLRAWQHIGTLQDLGPSQRRAWLYRTARNLFVDAMRRTAREDAALPELKPEPETPDPDFAEAEARRAYLSAHGAASASGEGRALDALTEELSRRKTALDTAARKAEKAENALARTQSLLAVLRRSGFASGIRAEAFTAEELPQLTAWLSAQEKPLEEAYFAARQNTAALHREQTGKRAELDAVSGGKWVYPHDDAATRVRDAVNAELQSRGMQPDAKIFCELLNVEDESWQDCVEACLGDRRFDILVPPAHYEAAKSAFVALKDKVGPISLLDTPGIRKANRRADKYGPDSLAAQVSSENPLAAQYAQTILGRIVCCDTPDTLEQHPDSATRDLLRHHPFRLERLRTPQRYIGLDARRARAGALAAELEALGESARAAAQTEQNLKAAYNQYQTLLRGTALEELAALWDARAALTAAQNAVTEQEAKLTECRENPLLQQLYKEEEAREAAWEAARAAVEQAGGTVLEVQYCDAQPDRAAAAMEAVMQKYPQGVDALLVTSDDMALAAIKCIWDNNSAAYRKTVICGFDGNHAAVEALDRGELTVDIAQQGYEMGYKAVEAALDALEGKSVESVIDSGSEVTTADNIDAYIADCREKGLWS